MSATPPGGVQPGGVPDPDRPSGAVPDPDPTAAPGPAGQGADPQPSPGSTGRSVLNAAKWQTIARFAPLVVNLSLTPYVILKLGAVGYGMWLIVNTLINFVGQVDGGLGATAQRYFAIFAGARDRRTMTSYLVTLVLCILGIGAVVLVPIAFSAGALADFFHAPADLREATTALFQVMVALVGLGFVRSLFIGVLQAHHKYFLTSLASLLGYAVYAALLFFGLREGHGLWAVAAAAIGQAGIHTLMVVPPALRLLTPRGWTLMSRKDFVDFWRFSLTLQAGGIARLISTNGTTLIVGRLAMAQVPHYGPGLTFSQTLRDLPTSALAPMQTVVGNEVGRNGPRSALPMLTALQRNWVRLVVGWTVAGAPAVWVGITAWLPLEGTLAGQVGAILVVSNMFMLLGQLTIEWGMLLRHPEIGGWSGVVGATVTLAFALLFVGPFGALGVAFAAVLGQVTALVLVLVMARNRLDVVPHSPLRDVPWGAATLALLTSSGLAYLVFDLFQRGIVPSGVLGLLCGGTPAIVALFVYLGLVFGWRRGLTQMVSLVRR